MYGGSGSDTYYVDNAADQVFELGDEGTDTVYASLNHTLSDNVENLFITGSALNGTGNALANVITGNANANVLSGGAGNDTLYGGAGGDRLLGGDGNDRLFGGDGLDYLTGGTGSDLFVAEIGGGKIANKQGMISVDVITDFKPGEDKIDLTGLDANMAMAGFQKFNWVGNASGKNAGDLSVQRFGSMDAAEAALGMELDGFDGKSPFGGPVSVVLGNVDGGAYDFALVLVGTPTVTVSDFQF
jgi:Ca2+-binding RTX toxin-like protein